MINSDTSDSGLFVLGVQDAGIPNSERIAIRADALVDLSRFGILLVWRMGNSGIPIRDSFFWFGSGLVMQGDWVFVYTAPGSPNRTTIPNTPNSVYSVHWGRTSTIFQDRNIGPALIRMDSVQFPFEVPSMAVGQSNPTLLGPARS